jgi:hypothetical protein
MKKATLLSSILAFFLVLLLLTPVNGPSVHAAGVDDFRDVSKDYWGRTFIGFAADAGIISGYPMDGGRLEFRPDNSVSREESMQMIYKAAVNSGTYQTFAPEPIEKYEALLTEHSIASWAWECITFGLENQILDASELASFRNDSGAALPATREEAARWAAKSLRRSYLPATSLDYPDKEQIAPNNLIYVDLLSRMNIMVGDNTGRFQAKAGIRRVEFAVICTRIYDLAAAPYMVEREYRIYSGTVSGSNGTTGKIFLTTPNGTSRVIDLETSAELVVNGRPVSRSEGFSALRSGQATVIAFSTFGQVHIQTGVVYGEGTVTALESMGGEVKAVSIQVSGGTAKYFLTGDTIQVDALKVGQTIRFLTDGVKLIETSDPV